MNELTVFEQNGKLLTDSRDVAVMVEMRHSDLLEKINGYVKHLTNGKFRSLDFFIEDEYVDSKGEKRPCYLCTREGCEMIANKMTGRKGIIFTAKYIEAFKRMKTFIEKGGQYSKAVPFKEQVECVGIIAEMLRVNDASKILMLNTLYKSYDLPSDFLPKYELNDNKELKSATDLLKRFELGMNVKNFNTLMVERGFLEERVRKSGSSPTGQKKYKALTEKGLKYGENAVSPQCQREVQPLYYVDTFKELFDIILGKGAA